MNIAVFSSHNGSDLQAIIDGCKSNKINAKVSLVISNNKDSMALKRAEKEKIPHFHLSNTLFESEEDLANKTLEILKDYDIDIIFLAGYMKLLHNNILDSFENRVFNIHPSLLPKYGGKGMFGINVHKAVINNKEKETGITIHRVNSKYDDGEIIVQKKVNVLENDNAESLAARVLEKEHSFLVEIISDIANGKININKSKILKKVKIKT